MRYDRVVEARFLQRPNRFIARCRLPSGEEVAAHVPNTGRCRELLLPEARVWLADHAGEPRKTRYTLVTVEKGTLLVNLDSQAPNRLVAEALVARALSLTQAAPTLIRPEFTYGESRLDFYLEAPGERVLAEVKGVTLEEGGIAAFPDAPTLRGLRHIHELFAAVSAGYRCAVIFVVQMAGMKRFVPNDAAQPEFRVALREAQAAGVRLLARECRVTPEEVVLTGEIPVCLDESSCTSQIFRVPK